MFKRFLHCVLGITMLSACVLQETSQAPEPVIEKQDVIPPKTHSLSAWWSFYNDATLDRIISSALALNPQSNNDSSLNLISDLIYTYLEYRYTQNQYLWLKEYLQSASPKEEERSALLEQEKTYAEKLERLKSKTTVQTKLLPEFVEEILKDVKSLPSADITPVMAGETTLINAYPGSFKKQQMNKFFGLDDTIFVSQEEFWKITPGTARQNTMSTNPETVRKAENLERDLIAYTHLREQTRILEEALSNQNLRDPNKYYQSRLGVLRAQYEKAKAITKIYTSLGVY